MIVKKYRLFGVFYDGIPFYQFYINLEVSYKGSKFTSVISRNKEEPGSNFLLDHRYLKREYIK